MRKPAYREEEARGGDLAEQHDFTTKQFSERFGNGTIAPDAAMLADPLVTAETVALDEIRQLIDLI